MMNLVDWVYLVPMVICSPCLLLGALFLPKIRIQLTRMFFQLPPALGPAKAHRVWVHAASVGEMALGIRLARLLEAEHKGLEVVFSTNRDTALDLAKAQGFFVCYRPFDFSFLSRSLVKRLNADLLVLIEAELWPNLVKQAERSVPVVMINGRLSDKNAQSYQRFRWIYRPLIGRLHRIFAGDQNSAERFTALGGEVQGTGNLKLGTTALPEATLVDQLSAQAGIKPKDFVLVFGSIQPQELSLMAPVIKELQGKIPQFRAIVVPRHPDKRAEFQAAAAEAQLSIELASKTTYQSADVFVVDQIGGLTALYSLSHLVFVGGSFTNRGGQNMVEPAGLGKPTAVGPYTDNFNEPVHLLQEAGGLAVLKSPEDLIGIALDPNKLHSLSTQGLLCLQQQQDHWKQVIEVFNEIISHRP